MESKYGINMNISLLASLLFHILIIFAIAIPMHDVKLEKKEEGISIRAKFVKIKTKKVVNPKVTRKKYSIRASKKDTKYVAKKTPLPKIKVKSREIGLRENLPKIDFPKANIIPKIKSKKIKLPRYGQNEVSLEKSVISNEKENIGLKQEKTEVILDEKDNLSLDIGDSYKEVGAHDIYANLDKAKSHKKSFDDNSTLSGVLVNVLEDIGAAHLSEDNVLPTYPKEAESKGWQGVVILRLNISKEGKVKNSSISRKSGYSVLDMAAKQGVIGWKIDNWEAMNGFVKIAMTFKLRR